MSDHVCQCRVCQPDRFPPDSHVPDRQSDGHVSVRFGDARQPLFIYLDGERLQLCLEAMAGEQGWAVVLSDPVHLCGCGAKEPCQYVRRGSVRIERT